MVLKSDYALGDTIPRTDIASVLFEAMLKYKHRTYMIESVTGRRYTFGETYDKCRSIGQALSTNHGLRKGDVVLVYSPNCPEYVLLNVGIMAIGVVVSTANPMYTLDELSYHINDCKPKLIVTIPENTTKVKQAVENCNVNSGIVVFGEASGCTPFSSLLQNDGRNLPQVRIDPDDTAFMLYSSGTTGKPKGVMCTHWSALSNMKQISAPHVQLINQDEDNTIIIYLPLYHIYAFFLAIIGLCSGDTVVIMPKYELFNFVQTVKKYKVTMAPLVPPTVVQMTKNAQIKASDFDSVRTFFYGAAPVGRDTEIEFSHKFSKQELRQGYGLTECTALTLVPKGVRLHPGSVGKVVPETDLKFVDTITGKEVGVNENGEILARGPQIMKGYYNKSQQTKETIDKEGWLHTGDVGYYDEEGYVYIVDRVKELIKYKGLQVAPADLEDLILSHPSVADCGVVGVPDLEAGELPRAYVVLKPQSTATEKSIIDFVAGQVAPHKKLRGGVKFLEAIPKSLTGKILRRVLKEQAIAEHKAKSKL